MKYRDNILRLTGIIVKCWVCGNGRICDWNQWIWM